MQKIIPQHRIQQLNYLRSIANVLSSVTLADKTSLSQESGLLSDMVELAAQRLEHAAIPEIGLTPRELIWQKNKSRLYRYTSGNRRFAIPLFVMYGLINKPTILDLTKKDSFIAFLVESGFTVYLLDWGNFGLEDAKLGISDLLLTYMPRAVRAMQRAENYPSYLLLGYCMGGTLASLWTAWASGQDTLAPTSLGLLASPIEFSQTGIIGNWLNADRFDVEQWTTQVGNIPGEWLTWGNMWVRPYENFFLPLKQLIMRSGDQPYFDRWLALDKWLHDPVTFPKRAFIEWIQCFYQQNQLTGHKYTLGSDPVHLSSISCPLMVVIAEKDQLVTPAQVEPLLTLTSSQSITPIRAETGHISLVLGTHSRETVWPAIVTWLMEQSNCS